MENVYFRIEDPNCYDYNENYAGNTKPNSIYIKMSIEGDVEQDGLVFCPEHFAKMVGNWLKDKGIEIDDCE